MPLSDLTKAENERNLKRLTAVMRQYDLKRAHVAKLLGVSRALVTFWFSHHKKCPDNAPELLRAVCSIEGKDKLLMKRDK